MQRIGIEMNQDAQYEIAERALTRFKRSLFTDETADGVNDAFFRALEEWPPTVSAGTCVTPTTMMRGSSSSSYEGVREVLRCRIGCLAHRALREPDNRHQHPRGGSRRSRDSAGIHRAEGRADGAAGVPSRRPAEPTRTKRFRRRSPQAQTAAEEETGRPRELLGLG